MKAKKVLLGVAITAAAAFGGYGIYSSLQSSGTIYYISTSGNDANNGSSSSPWKTLLKATSTVSNAGDVIHVNAGTYNETQKCNLKVGVSIEGDGATTTILKVSSGIGGEFLSLNSPQNTNGNQSISGITIDGQYASENNKGAGYGIRIDGRSNVTIHHCKIINFYYNGVIFDGFDATSPMQDPGISATGNKILNCEITNCSTVTQQYGNGCVMIGGQTGLVIDSCNIGTTTRVKQKNGWAIKYWDNGYLKGCRILNSTLTKPPFQNTYWTEAGDWDFVIELFNIQGVEISGCNIQGAIDLNYNYKGSYPYSVWIHNCILDHVIPNYSHPESGIIFEFKTESALVENNRFNNCFVGISYNLRYPNNHGGYTYNCGTGGCSAVTDNIIRNNLFTNLYQAPFGASGGIITQMENGTEDPYITNMQIYNNTFIAKSTQAAPTGIDFTSQSKGTVTGVTIKDNIFQGFPGGSVTGNKAQTQSNISITNNDAWQTQLPTWSGATVSGNFSSNPNFNANYISTLGIGYTGVNIPPPGNVTPTANAGADQTITLPINTVTLIGSGTDPDGTIASYQWKLGTNIVGNTASLVLSNLVAGDYDYTLTVTDNLGSMSTPDAVHVKVNPNTPPPPANDTIRASVIQYGINLTRKNVSYFVKRPDGFFYDGNTKRDIYLYKALDGKWFYLAPDRKWIQLF